MDPWLLGDRAGAVLPSHRGHNGENGDPSLLMFHPQSKPEKAAAAGLPEPRLESKGNQLCYKHDMRHKDCVVCVLGRFGAMVMCWGCSHDK